MSDTQDANMKSVKVPSLNGKKEGFQTWWIRCKPCGNAYGFLPALSIKAEDGLPVTEEASEDETDVQQGARKRNKSAVYYVTLAFTTDEAMEFYHKGVTDNYPSGLAWLIVKAFHAQFKPQDTISAYELSGALWNIKMSPKESPDVMVSRIAALKSYYVVLDYDELQLIAVVSNAVTTEYMVIIAVEERRHKKA
jgi:hypothetical protein